MEVNTISILGCGWFGLPFAKALVTQGFTVKGSTTSVDKLNLIRKEGIEPFQINLNEMTDFPTDFFDVDVLFVNVPPRAKTESVLSYPDKLRRISAAATNVKEIVFISSTGVFEDGNFEVDENSIPKPETDASIALQEAEQVFKTNTNFNTTIIRFAGLIGPGRNLAKFFAGRTDVPNGKAPINLITLEDCIELCVHLLHTQKFGGIYHAVTPHHPTRKEFYSKLCEVSGMEKPVFKDELLAWKQINSINVPRELDYDFKVKNWFEWMNSLSFGEG